MNVVSFSLKISYYSMVLILLVMGDKCLRDGIK